MSAQALLASILPIAPAPQGPAASAVAGEGEEFAALVEAEAGNAPTEAVTSEAVSPEVEADAPSVVVASGDPQTETAMPVVSLVVIAPEGPVALPAEVTAKALSEGEAQTAQTPTADTPSPPSPAAANLGPDVPSIATPDRPVPDQRALAPLEHGRKGDGLVQSGEAAPVVEGAEKAAQGEKPAAETQSPTKGEPTAASSPLKSLPERTSRPTDAGHPALDAAARAEGQRPEGAATPQTSATPAIPAAPSAHGQAKAGRFEPVAATDASAPASSFDAAAPADTPAAPEQSAVAQVREAAAGLSRVAIEATAQIAAQILRKLEGRSTRFEMALLPEELGRVDVKLDIDSEGRLHARLAFDNPVAATDLRGRVDDLRRQLEQQGFEIGADAFEFTERDPGSHAFDRGQEQRGRGRAFAAASRLEAEAEVVAVGRYNVSLSPSGVDVRV